MASNSEILERLVKFLPATRRSYILMRVISGELKDSVPKLIDDVKEAPFLVPGNFTAKLVLKNFLCAVRASIGELLRVEKALERIANQYDFVSESTPEAVRETMIQAERLESGGYDL